MKDLANGRRSGERLTETAAQLERREMAMACMREVLINHSLDTGNEGLFDRMTGDDWRTELTSGSEREMERVTREVKRDLGDRWEMQLLNVFVGEVDYYYKEDVIYQD